MTKKQIIRLTESDLQNIIKEAVEDTLKKARKLRSDEKRITQLDMFGNDDVKIVRPKRVSPAEKERRRVAKQQERQEAKEKAKREAEKAKEKMWNDRGIFQMELFDGIK